MIFWHCMERNRHTDLIWVWKGHLSITGSRVMELTSLHFLLALRAVSNAALQMLTRGTLLVLDGYWWLYSRFSHPGSIWQVFAPGVINAVRRTQVKDRSPVTFKHAAHMEVERKTLCDFSILKYKVQISLTIKRGNEILRSPTLLKRTSGVGVSG